MVGYVFGYHDSSPASCGDILLDIDHGANCGTTAVSLWHTTHYYLASHVGMIAESGDYVGDPISICFAEKGKGARV